MFKSINFGNLKLPTFIFDCFNELNSEVLNDTELLTVTFTFLSVVKKYIYYVSNLP